MQSATNIRKTSWSRKHDKCLKCETQEYPHRSRGLCSRCYNDNREKKQKSHINRKSRKLEEEISIHELKFLYEVQQMSLNTDKRRAFYFRHTGVDCAKLYHVLYDGVPEGM
jgi:hypothetical protein